MFTTPQQLPSIEEIQAFRHDSEAVRAAVKLRATISAQVFLMTPEAMLAVAMQQFPCEDAHSAILKLHAEFDHVLRALTQFGEDVTSLAQAETERLAPMVAEAARRDLEIPRALEGVNNELRSIEIRTAEREASLRRAGVKGEDIQRLMSEGEEDREARRADLKSQRQALLAEQEALCEFLQTGNEKHLPEGFSIVAVPRISGRDAVRNHVETRWAA
jgi:hypothetical protein